MKEVPMCRICKAVGVRLQSIISTHLQKMYETLARTPFVTNDDRPRKVCYMCYTKLEKCYRLQKHCLQSDEQFRQMRNSNIPLPLDLRVNLHTKRLARTDVLILSMGHVCEEDEEFRDSAVKGGGSQIPSGDTVPVEQKPTIEEDSRPLDVRVDPHTKRLARLAPTDVSILSIGHVKEEEPTKSEVRGGGSHLPSGDTVPVEPTPTIQEDSRPLDLRVDLPTRRLASLVLALTDVLTLCLGHGEEDEEELANFEFRDDGSPLPSGDIVPVEQKPTIVEDSRPLDLRMDIHNKRLATLARTDTFILSMGHVEEDEEDLIDSEVRGGGSHLLSGNTVPVEQTPTIQEDSRPLDLRLDLHISRLARLALALTDVLILSLGYVDEDEEELTDSEVRGGGSHLPSGDTDPVEPTPTIQDSRPLESKVDLNTKKLVKQARTDVIILHKGHEENEEELRDSEVKDSGSHLPSVETPVELPGKKTVPKDTNDNTHRRYKKHECHICQGRFTFKFQLEVHLNKHTRPYRCHMCGRCFTQENNLKSHLLLHSWKKPYQCVECYKCFPERVNVERHMRTHTGKKTYQCNVCEVRLSKRTSLCRHMRMHIPDWYQCFVCKEFFSSDSNLSRHLRTHNYERNKCDVCKICYSNKNNLRRHYTNYHSEKQYKCNVCNKGFMKEYNLAKHLNIHKG